METENKRYTVTISDKATEMMVSHARFLAQVSEKAADNLVLEFTVAVESLEQFPERNPWLSDPALPINKYRELLVGKRYLLIYQVKYSTVHVDFVVDCRQDYKWLL